MQENKIKLPNRYNEEVYLEKIEDTKYKLVHRSSYVRLGTINGVKDKLSVGVVKSINRIGKDYIIEVET